MKKIYSNLFGAGAFAALVVLAGESASAQTSQPPGYPNYYYYHDSPGDTGFNFGADLGLSIMQDFNSSRFGFPGHFSPEVGTRFDVAPGYDFLSSGGVTLGVDFETGLSYNEIHNVQSAGVETPLRLHYYQVPVLGDLVLKFHPDSFVVPYIGVGGGGDFSAVRNRFHSFYGPWEENDEMDPAVQAMAGVRFRMNSAIEFGLGYKYLAAFSSGNATVASHAVLASFCVKF